VFARDAALRVACEGVRLVRGAGAPGEPEPADLETALRVPEIAAAQAGAIDDMDTAADLIYGR
jgi:hypothetical protein